MKTVQDCRMPGRRKRGKRREGQEGRTLQCFQSSSSSSAHADTQQSNRQQTIIRRSTDSQSSSALLRAQFRRQTPSAVTVMRLSPISCVHLAQARFRSRFQMPAKVKPPERNPFRSIVQEKPCAVPWVGPGNQRGGFRYKHVLHITCANMDNPALRLRALTGR